MTKSKNLALSYADSAAIRSSTRYVSDARDEKFLLFSPPFDTSKSIIWLPGDTPEDSLQVAKSLDTKLNKNPVGIVTSSGWMVRRVGNERQVYLGDLERIKDTWIRNGGVVDEAIANSMKDARNRLRSSIRKRSFIPGVAYQAIDGSRSIYKSTIRRMGGEVRVTVAEKLAQGKLEDVIRGSFKFNPKFGPNFIKVTKSVGKSLGVISTVVSALDIPYAAYKSYTAVTKEEQNDAIEMFASSSATTAHAAICLAMGVGTGGLGLLACGILPVFTGTVVGSVARTIANELDKQESQFFQ